MTISRPTPTSALATEAMFHVKHSP
jgi:hypothetical protein